MRLARIAAPEVFTDPMATMTRSAHETSACVIETDGLCRDFGGRRAVDNVTLRVPAGGVFGLLGPNGAGKTSTIRLLLGVLEPSSGSARVFGLDTRTQGAAIRERAGALLEHAGLYERLSAEDNLEFYGRAFLMPQADRRRRIEELLTRFGLWDRRRDTVAAWSRGMKQKLAIARTMLHRPQLLFLDEPTAGLDPIAAATLRDDLADLVAREHVTVFLTTHNLAEAEVLCDTVAVLREGQVLAIGSPRELRAGSQRAHVTIAGRGFGPGIISKLRERTDVTAVRATDSGGVLAIDLAADADIATLVALIVTHGGRVEEVLRGPASLEDAFRVLVEEAP